MPNKMLIDASHPEETRVVVLRGNRIEEFDFESASKRQLRGNIYLAKVTRVEPSLQAAFVEYGGNRHGFLAFSEIHPDYYQIPVADRQALLEEEARAHAQDEDEERGSQNQQRRGRRRRPDRFQRRRRPDEAVTGSVEGAPALDENGAPVEAAPEQSADGFEPAEGALAEAVSHGDAPAGAGSSPPDDDHAGHGAEREDHESHTTARAEHEAHDHARHDHAHEAPAPEDAAHGWHEPASEHEAAATPTEAPSHSPVEDAGVASHERRHETAAPDDEPVGEAEADGYASEDTSDQPVEAREPADEDEDDDEEAEEEVVEQVGGGDSEEDLPRRAPRSRRQYKIQEVIKRRQVLLVQVVKEERGGKGAALTTYLSLAGRYSVLMPNTARGGGISRKITDAADRRKLKEIAQSLDVPEGMGVILRTAGAARTTGEVTRDFEYLLRMWESVRELTLESTAPSLVYEEGSLIKRSIRDLYNSEIDEVTVSGDAGFVEARDYMRMLMPSHEKNVKQWREPQALFAKSGVESQLDSMFSNIVTLRSGGYLVINQAEALVAIDVNSGRSTREHNIEDTALRTNLEAADEVARQLRLRDLAGLIVVDFIDMEEHRNNRSVERRVKEALKNDRARIQVGRISHFGLLEMSRQRMRTGVVEGSTIPCPHCAGTGHMRSTASLALHVLRAIEDALAKSATHNILVRARGEVALYVLNHKRASLRDIEQRFGVSVIVAADDTLTGSTYHAIERGEPATPPAPVQRRESVRIDSVEPPPAYEEPAEDEEAEDEETANGADEQAAEGAGEAGDSRSRKRRRRRRGRGDRETSFQPHNAPQPTDGGLEFMARVGGLLPGEQVAAPIVDGEVDVAEAEGFEADAPAADNQNDGNGRQNRSRRGGRRRRGAERGERSWDHPAHSAASGDDATVGALPEHDDTGGHIAAEPSSVDATETFVAEKPIAAVATPVAPEPVHAAPEPAPVEASRPAEPPPAYIAPLPEAAVDPTQPKRAGWWQRAKQSFGG